MSTEAMQEAIKRLTLERDAAYKRIRDLHEELRVVKSTASVPSSVKITNVALASAGPLGPWDLLK